VAGWARLGIPVLVFAALPAVAAAPVVPLQEPASGSAASSAARTPDFSEAVAAARELPRFHSLLISHRGQLLLEQYFNGARATRPANIKSASKSVLSALVGIALERGLIKSVEQPIADFFPSLRAPKVDPRKRDITIEDLLTMRSGLQSTSNRYYGAWVTSRNWVQYVLDRPLLSEPGTEMDYSTGNSHLLSAILTKATGTSTWQFAQDALARPMGLTLDRWPRDPQGIYFGGNDMLMTPRQMVAFGELYLNDGEFNGRQIVPEDWIEQSFVVRARSRWSDQFYGYGWWTRELAGREVRYAWGFGGQFIFVVDDLDLVIVTTSSSTADEERRGHRRTVYEIVEELIIGQMS
jgi:CubicO group peptidase (beta-lactamase class C family)